MTALQYLCDLIAPYSNARELRSNNKPLIKPYQYYIYSPLNVIGYWTLNKCFYE